MGEFDGLLYPCQATPNGAKNASDLLSPAERTFTASGVVEYDDVQDGTFSVSPARPLAKVAARKLKGKAILVRTDGVSMQWTGNKYTVVR